MSTSPTEGSPDSSPIKGGKTLGKRHKKQKTTSMQSARLLEPSNALDHLKLALPDPMNLEGADIAAYNKIVADATMLRCYICDSYGHFVEECPVHLRLVGLNANNKCREAIYNVALRDYVELKKKK